MITSVMLARQMSLPRPLATKLTPFLRYSCRLFVAPKKVNSFVIKQIQTLSQKYPGWGYLRASPKTLHPYVSTHFIDFLLLCFYRLTNPFSRNSRVFTSIQIGECFFVLARRYSAFSTSPRYLFPSHLPRSSNLSTFNCRLSTALLVS
jgi:hypothetical protein